jgi:cytochrome c553
MSANFQPIAALASLPAALRRVTAIIVTPVIAILAAHLPCASAATAAESAAATCFVCHGKHGEGAVDGVPRLAGQDAAYMQNALSMFKAGKRASAVMQPIARTLSDSAISGLADYFSQQRAPLAVAAAPAPPERVLAGKRLAEQGAANVAACFSCHAAQGKGNGARFPSIAGQPARFVVNRLREFQARAQAAAPQPGTMTAVAATLDDRQIEQAAAYLSTLP